MVGGKRNVLVHYVDVGTPIHLVLSSVSLLNKILCVHFWFKIMFFLCACLNHRSRKVVGDKHNVLKHYVDVSAPDPSVTVICNPFKCDILWFISEPKSCFFCVCATKAKTNFIHQPQEQKRCRWQTQCSSALCECLCTQPIWCCLMKPTLSNEIFCGSFLVKNLVILCVCLP